MEINPSFAPLPKKGDVESNNRGCVTETPVYPSLNSIAISGVMLENLPHEIIQLKQQQQLEQQFLLQHFQAQRRQMYQEHEKQLQEQIKMYLEKQSAQMEEEARLAAEREKEKLEALKNKDERDQSAIASSEVKQRLQEFVLNKQREAAAAASGGGSGGAGAGSPTLRSHFVRKYEDDFPLRKTASEPNLKGRLKGRVMSRGSPLNKRRDRFHPLVKRRSQLANASHLHNRSVDSSTASTPDSDPNSPPSAASGHSSSGSTIHEENPIGGGGGGGGGCGGVTNLFPAFPASIAALYTSPSLPNISLGRPPAPPASISTAHATALAAAINHDGGKLIGVGEGGGAGEGGRVGHTRGVSTVTGTIPLSLPQVPTLPPPLPPYYPIPMDGEMSTSPVCIQRQMALLEGAVVQHPLLTGMYPPGPITDAQVAQVRLSKVNQRPLNRTQSAPLPLGHPVLAALSIRDRQAFLEHQYLKQQLRATVLTRAGSKNHVENVEEETEAAVAQEMQATDPPGSGPGSVSRPGGRSHKRCHVTGMLDQGPEVIDLTDSGAHHKYEPGTPFQIHREFLLRQQQQHQSSECLAGSGSLRMHHTARPLSRALSSPLVTLGPTTEVPGPGPPNSKLNGKGSGGTALAFDSLMLKHQCVCGNNAIHPEHGGRLQSIWARLGETGLATRCEKIRSRKASLDEIQCCHTEAHTLLFGTNPLNRQKLDLSKFPEPPIKSFVLLPCGGVGVDSDTTWDELHTGSAARMAVGCVLELAFKVAQGEMRNGFAVVRPPGHHAEPQQAMGFCFFNNIAIAARQLRYHLGLEKILIVDWDVHHGNGTQSIFYDDCHVLYISIHRHDCGNFFPGTGGPTECGLDDGMGFNINIAWSGGLVPPIGDSEYLAAFRTVIMPIARDFNPDIVLVSSGFDAAAGHPPPLGGYTVSPAGFAHMTRQLMSLANGKVVLALEGGYDLPSVCDCTEACVRALLGDALPPLPESSRVQQPCQNAIDTLQKTIAIQASHWPVVRKCAHAVRWSPLEAESHHENDETVSALASLSVHTSSAAQQQPTRHTSVIKSESKKLPPEEPMEEDSK